MAKALQGVKELNAIDVELLFPSVKAFVQGAVLGVSGLAGLAVLAGISVRDVGSRSLDARLLVRDWKQARTRMNLRSMMMQMAVC